MSIRQDAGKLLIYIYIKYEEGQSIKYDDIKRNSKWEDVQIRNAIKYLKDRDYVKVIFFLGGSFFIEDVYPKAIDIVENNEEFLNTFGFPRGQLENFLF